MGRGADQILYGEITPDRVDYVPPTESERSRLKLRMMIRSAESEPETAESWQQLHWLRSLTGLFGALDLLEEGLRTRRIEDMTPALVAASRAALDLKSAGTIEAIRDAPPTAALPSLSPQIARLKFGFAANLMDSSGIFLPRPNMSPPLKSSKKYLARADERLAALEAKANYSADIEIARSLYEGTSAAIEAL